MMNIFFIICDEKKTVIFITTPHSSRTALADQDMSQQEAFDDLQQTMASARLNSQTSSELDKSIKDPANPEDDDLEGDPDDLEEEEEEELFVQHDQVTQGLISYDTVHKQLATASKKDSTDLDYEYEGKTQ